MTTSCVFSFRTKGHSHNREVFITRQRSTFHSTQEGNSYRIFRGSEGPNLLLWLHLSFREETLRFWLNWCHWKTTKMPSMKKTLHYLSSALATSISVGVLGFSMSQQWAKTTMNCARGGTSFFNGTAVIVLALFDGDSNRNFCPSFGSPDDFKGNFRGALKGSKCGQIQQKITCMDT